MYVSSLHVYPVKGCKGIDVQEAEIGPRSFKFDRHWIIIDAEGEKITQREEPRLALIHTKIQDDTLTLSAREAGRTHIDINTVPDTQKRVDVWGDDSPGLVERKEASQWLSDFLRQPVTLLRFDQSQTRPVVPEWGGDTGSHIAFNDCMPLLVANQSSLDALNDWRAEHGLAPSPMDRFRPNIVLTGAEPWAEDEWLAIETSDGIHLDLTRPCSRCQVTNVDQLTGTPEPIGNLHVLGKHRHAKNYLGRPGAFFGVQALVLGCEGRSIRVGDSLRVAGHSALLPGMPRLVP